jgi:purine nucleosidase
VLAVTVVGGNVGLDACVRNALAVAPRVRVARGLMPPRAEGARHIHGADGLGGAAHLLQPAGAPDPAPAPDVILELADGATLLTLGPLTNAAAALQTDTVRFRKLERIVSMGGAWNVPGNVEPAAEYNVWCDPAAAQAVFDSGVPVKVVGLDVTRQVRVEQSDLAAAPEFVRRMCAHSGWSRYLHDPLAAGVAIDPTFVQTRRCRAAVDANGRTRAVEAEGSVHVAHAVDAPRFLSFFLSRIQEPEP